MSAPLPCTELVEKERKALRAGILARRLALDPGEVARLSERIRVHLVGMAPYRECRTLLGYVSFRQEVDTLPLLREALEGGKRLVLPRVNRRERTLELYRVTDLVDLQPGYQGILEPDPRRCSRVDPDEIELVLVPGVAFDRRGYRLGYGGGYYDRLLTDIPRALKAGLAFSLQVVEFLPIFPHDQPVDLLVTEEGILRFGLAP